MRATEQQFDAMVTELVPSLSRSLGARFNVFRVMHHGTHEKQLSNVFAWLLKIDETHGLHATFQRIFLTAVNRGLPEDCQVPLAPYEVRQEVGTVAPDSPSRDVADIVLQNEDATIVVENYWSSDGHGHDYDRYVAHRAAVGRVNAVVLLCEVREPHRQTRNWEKAAVVTYAELIGELRDAVATDSTWREQHREQAFFIGQMVDQFVKGVEEVSTADSLAFIKAMCDSGESARYGQRPLKAVTVAFGKDVSKHAEHQLVESRKVLGAIKHALRRYADTVLVGQVGDELVGGRISSVETKFVGRWEWCVTFRRAEGAPTLYLEFGPTAVVQNDGAPSPVENPDYGRVFVVRQRSGGDHAVEIRQTSVGLDEVLSGLSRDDRRLADALVEISTATDTSGAASRDPILTGQAGDNPSSGG